MSPVSTRTIAHMGNARHKRKYPEGRRVQMTDAWKQRVRDRLSDNKRNGIKPLDQVQLAAAVGAADKSAISVMLKPDTTASKLVDRVCEVLQIAAPLEERKERDQLDEEAALLVDQATRDAFAALLREFRTKKEGER